MVSDEQIAARQEQLHRPLISLTRVSKDTLDLRFDKRGAEQLIRLLEAAREKRNEFAIIDSTSYLFRFDASNKIDEFELQMAISESEEWEAELHLKKQRIQLVLNHQMNEQFDMRLREAIDAGVLSPALLFPISVDGKHQRHQLFGELLPYDRPTFF